MTRGLFLVLACALSGCVLDGVDLGDRPCPCVGAYTCDTAQSRCVRAVSGPYTLAASPVRVRVATSVTLDVSLDSDIDQTVDVSLSLPTGLAATPGTLALSKTAQHGAFVLSASTDASPGRTPFGLNGTDSTGKTQRFDVDVEILPRPGSLDTTFGTGGAVALAMQPMARVSHLAVLADDRIVVASSGQKDIYVTRLAPDGALDTAFGGSGVTVLSSGSDMRVSETRQVIALASGKVLVVGGDYVQPISFVVQLDGNGQLDASFGTGGVASPAFASCAAVRADGRIVVAGTSTGHLAVLQLHPDGSLDPGFGTNGQTTTMFGADDDAPAAVALFPDGRIAVVGFVRSNPTVGFLALFTSNGVLDDSFGSKGVVLGEDSTFFDSVVNGPGETLVIGGGTGNLDGDLSAPDPSHVALVRRFTMSGAPDVTFGTSGSTSIPTPFLNAAALTFTDFGSIAFLTQTSLGELTSDGMIDSAFQQVAAPGSFELDDMARQSTSKLVVVGEPFFGEVSVLRYAP